MVLVYFFFSSRRRHTRCALVTGVQTFALPISIAARPVSLPHRGTRLALTAAPAYRAPMHDMHGKTMIVLLSGGLDSLVCAGLAREAGARIVALTVDYNQRHRVELESAARLADFVGAAEHIVLPLDLRRFGGSALTADIDVPKEDRKRVRGGKECVSTFRSWWSAYH